MRGKKAPKRQILPDPKYNDVSVSKFINYIMKDGKKTIARRIVYRAFDLVEEKSQQPAKDVFDKALKNVTPSLEVKSRRVGGANYQVPIPVRGERRLLLSFRWILDSARAKKGRPIADRIAEELFAASNGEGEAVKKRAAVQKMAEANRAFAHFAR